MISTRSTIPYRLKYFFCCGIYLSAFTYSFGQWQWLNPKPSSYINSKIIFSSHQTGFILNSAGDLYKTTNTGDSWQLIENFPRAICMDIADSTGVIAGYNGTVYISADNGDHWELVNTSFGDAIETINIVSRDTIFVSNGFHNSYANGNIYQSTDRGRTWVALHCNVSIHALTFLNSKLGFAAGPQSTILKTIDGGVSWEQKRKLNIAPTSITCMQFLDEDTGYAFQEYSSLLRTTDGGDTWSSSDASETMRSMHFVNSRDGYLGGDDGAMMATHDGGSTFSWIGFDGLRDGNAIYSVYFITKDTGFAVGLLGRIIKTTDAGLHWSAYDSSTYLPITGVSFGTATTGYATSWNKMYKTANKGQTWITLNLSVGTEYASQSRFTHAHFTSADTGFVISSYPAQVHFTTDGGNSWQVINPLNYGADYVMDMQFINAKTGFISLYPNMYYGSAIAKTTDGGLTWTEESTPTNNIPLRHIFYTNQDTGYAVDYARILKTTDGSKNWNVVYPGDFTELSSIEFTSAKEGVVAVNDGHILITADSGQTWNSVTTPVTGIQALNFFNRQVGYLTTRNFGPTPYGSLYQTIDSGKTWQMRKDVSANSIVFTPDSSVIFAGYGGLIVSSKMREVYVDSVQVVKIQDGCSSTLSAVVTAVFSSADSISFSVTSKGGKVFSIPATPANINNRRATITAGTDSLSKDSVYTISARYFYDGAYRYSNSIVVKFAGNVNNWTGMYSTSWEDPLNWSCGTVPGTGTDVIVNSSAQRYPVISSNAVCKSLNMSPGTRLTINDGYALTVMGK